MKDSGTDKRHILDGEPFSYQTFKDCHVFIFWNGKRVTTLRGEESEQFLMKMQGASIREAQLVMAKITGNFKHGNEKAAKNGS